MAARKNITSCTPDNSNLLVASYIGSKGIHTSSAKSNYDINWELPNFYKQGMYRIGIEVGASIDSLRYS